MSVPVFINCRDRLTPLRELVAWLEGAGHERIVLLDNDSRYEPLLDYLRASPHSVVALGANLGARALWDAGLVPDDTPFVYTDPDVVPLSDCPPDAVEHLAALLERYPDLPKAGLGLYLDDVPAGMHSLGWERSLVSTARELEPGVFDSLIDTTFALYRPGTEATVMRAIRTGAPYQARHASAAWYPHLFTDEDEFYLSRAIGGPAGSSWRGIL